jgi:endogenous inhibitor of DNA gyrase (YacG/DUF329 family)
MSDENCVYCGREFFNFKGTRKFCSTECRNADYYDKHPGFSTEYRRKKRVVSTLKCRNCGKEYETTNTKKIFCTEQCKVSFHNSARPVTKFELRICPQCGKSFRPMQKKGIGRTYCTAVCRNKWFNDKRVVASKSINWSGAKKAYKWDGNWFKALTRDGFTCQLCGLKRIPSARTTDRRYILEVHHRDGSGETGDKHHDLDNLTTLCAECHREFHTKINLVFVDGRYQVRGKIFSILNLRQVDTIGG